MIVVNKTPAFDRRFKKLSPKQKTDFYKAIGLFYKSPFHPQLRTHKLKGIWSSFWSFSINYSDRCIFYFINKQEVLLYDIGSHKIYEK